MTTSDTLISVIIPVYNGERYLAETIESALSQTYQPIEVIVVDDGSTDGTAEVAKRFAPFVQYCYQSNSGAGAARNQGVELAQGDIFAFLDADDLWVEDKLVRQMAAFETNRDVDIVFAHVKQFYSPELDESIKKSIHMPAEVIPGQIPSAITVKRESFFQVGLFETNWKVGEGVSWILRAKEQGLRTIMLPEILVMRRLHENNKGTTHRQFINQRVHIIKASLDRRRKMGLLHQQDSKKPGNQN